MNSHFSPLEMLDPTLQDLGCPLRQVVQPVTLMKLMVEVAKSCKMETQGQKVILKVSQELMFW